MTLSRKGERVVRASSSSNDNSLLGMAVPGLVPGISFGHPDAVKRMTFLIEITGTRPVMT
jgi:hypothetical protein